MTFDPKSFKFAAATATVLDRSREADAALGGPKGANPEQLLKQYAAVGAAVYDPQGTGDLPDLQQVFNLLSSTRFYARHDSGASDAEVLVRANLDAARPEYGKATVADFVRARSLLATAQPDLAAELGLKPAKATKRADAVKKLQEMAGRNSDPDVAWWIAARDLATSTNPSVTAADALDRETKRRETGRSAYRTRAIYAYPASLVVAQRAADTRRTDIFDAVAAVSKALKKAHDGESAVSAADLLSACKSAAVAAMPYAAEKEAVAAGDTTVEDIAKAKEQEAVNEAAAATKALTRAMERVATAFKITPENQASAIAALTAAGYLPTKGDSLPGERPPQATEPKATEPKAEEPKAEEPKAEEPKAEEPKPMTRKQRNAARAAKLAA